MFYVERDDTPIKVEEKPVYDEEKLIAQIMHRLNE
jgi:hypothetical protein